MSLRVEEAKATFPAELSSVMHNSKFRILCSIIYSTLKQNLSEYLDARKTTKIYFISLQLQMSPFQGYLTAT